MSANTQAVSAEEVNEVVAANPGKPANLSLEALMLLINAERLKFLHDSSHAEFKELKKRQEDVSFLHKLLKKINAQTTANGELNLEANSEIHGMLAKAKELGVELKDGLTSFTKDDKDLLVSNIKMTVDDLNVKNDMQLQTINRLTNERYEAYQMARSILKPLHDSKMKIAQGIRQ